MLSGVHQFCGCWSRCRKQSGPSTGRTLAQGGPSCFLQALKGIFFQFATGLSGLPRGETPSWQEWEAGSGHVGHPLPAAGPVPTA